MIVALAGGVGGAKLASGLAAILPPPANWGGGLPGDLVVLEGTGFDVATPANNVVKFTASGGGTVTAPVLAAGGTQLHVRIPDTAAQGDVTVVKSSETAEASGRAERLVVIRASFCACISAASWLPTMKTAPRRFARGR